MLKVLLHLEVANNTISRLYILTAQFHSPEWTRTHVCARYLLDGYLHLFLKITTLQLVLSTYRLGVNH